MAVTNLDNDLLLPLNLMVRKKPGGYNTPGMNVPGDDYNVSLVDWLNNQMAKDYITSIVSIATTQTITGNKTFSGTSTFSGAVAMDGGLTMDTNKFIVANTSQWLVLLPLRTLLSTSQAFLRMQITLLPLEQALLLVVSIRSLQVSSVL
jgi:hypothetical protein